MSETVLIDDLLNSVANLQFALRVAFELAAYGPGTAPQIAERMMDHDEECATIDECRVCRALAELDNWSLLEYSGLEGADTVRLLHCDQTYEYRAAVGWEEGDAVHVSREGTEEQAREALAFLQSDKGRWYPCSWIERRPVETWERVP